MSIFQAYGRWMVTKAANHALAEHRTTDVLSIVLSHVIKLMLDNRGTLRGEAVYPLVDA